MAVCVAVIGKDNSPLYLRTSSPEYDLKFRFAVHTSLDVVEEKISSSSRGTGDFRELYLGLLYPTEDYKIFGYVTNTHVKFIVIIELSNASFLRDNEIRSMFRKLHNAYTDLVCNPFYTFDESIVSRPFENVVRGMMTS